MDKREIDRLLPEMVEWRRHLHRHPETSYQEKETSAFVAAKLEAFGIEVKRSKAGYGLTGILKGSRPGKTVVLRADMDALNITEESGSEYASQNPGVMHACGHDGHTAMLLGAAAYYSARRDGLKGELRFLFQPAEEICPGGAKDMIAEGVLDGADAIYGLHLWTPLPLGTVGSAPGPLMASADEFFIDITGRGGHGGMPHRTVDSIVAAAALVTQLQTIVSRSVDPLQPAVLSIGTIQGGTAQNIIAERCRITGTVRAFDEETRYLIRTRIEEMASAVAAVYGAEAKVDYMMGYPPLVNDEAEFRRFMRVAPEALGDEAQVIHMEKIMPAEDFAYYVKEIPGCFIFVGAGNADKNAVYPHHHSKFDFDEDALLHGATLLVALADSCQNE
ncbi:peptidase M20 [Paenibacillus sp. FSL R7-0273]|uniref:M20 metallopeptidase family protein n=1 Tax=Paenibacillus sp. FSL R7-0273 TaxID=1536772 RepID=UPI0004F64F03|nr:M20 family metallopeptidase [Paenibacillus sp. FSL R7-0273]AIQ46774.1 peptidase M20 [Paenibacillus sp. FSL R7-0273]OMF97454.1 peptidase M20 [Paenibacillus sp. FSL R7-0273]